MGHDRQLAAVTHHAVYAADGGVLLRAGLRRAARDENVSGRVFVNQPTDQLTGFAVGFGCDGAGVDHIYVADIPRGARQKPCGGKRLRDGLGFVLVDLASQRQNGNGGTYGRMGHGGLLFSDFLSLPTLYHVGGKK